MPPRSPPKEIRCRLVSCLKMYFFSSVFEIRLNVNPKNPPQRVSTSYTGKAKALLKQLFNVFEKKLFRTNSPGFLTAFIVREDTSLSINCCSDLIFNKDHTSLRFMLTFPDSRTRLGSYSA
jgi:hypothetical protein